MKKSMNILLVILTILYIASPLDLLPGPIDDFIVAGLEIYHILNGSTHTADSSRISR